MLAPKRLRCRQATPLVPRKAVSRRNLRADQYRTRKSSSDESIELFRDNDDTPVPIHQNDLLFTRKSNPVKRLELEPEARSCPDTIQLTDDELPLQKKVPHFVCSTPVHENFTRFKNFSAILSPVTCMNPKTEHTDGAKAKEKSSNASKVNKIPKKESTVIVLEEAANNQQTETCYKTSAGKFVPGIKTAQEGKIIHTLRDKQAPPIHTHPTCPIAAFTHKYRIANPVKVYRKKNTNTRQNNGKQPHEYRQCPLETLNWLNKKPR